MREKRAKESEHKRVGGSKKQREGGREGGEEGKVREIEGWGVEVSLRNATSLCATQRLSALHQRLSALHQRLSHITHQRLSALHQRHLLVQRRLRQDIRFSNRARVLRQMRTFSALHQPADNVKAYEVPTISRLLKITGSFCKRAL